MRKLAYANIIPPVVNHIKQVAVSIRDLFFCFLPKSFYAYILALVISIALRSHENYHGFGLNNVWDCSRINRS